MEFSPGSGAITNFPKIGASETRRNSKNDFRLCLFCLVRRLCSARDSRRNRRVYETNDFVDCTDRWDCSMRTPLDKIVANFQAKMNHKVKVTYGTGLSTRQSIAKGEPLDVTLAVAPFFGAIASGNVIPSSATPIASFLMAVAVPKNAPKPDISSPAAVKQAFLAAKTIGFVDPDFGSAGQGATEAIMKLG